MDDIWVCNQTFFCEYNGHPLTVSKGTTVRDGHPLMKGRECYFTPFLVDHEYTAPEEEGKHAKTVKVTVATPASTPAPAPSTGGAE